MNYGNTLYSYVNFCLSSFRGPWGGGDNENNNLFFFLSFFNEMTGLEKRVIIETFNKTKNGYNVYNSQPIYIYEGIREK
jgi:hypothetical protein